MIPLGAKPREWTIKVHAWNGQTVTSQSLVPLQFDMHTLSYFVPSQYTKTIPDIKETTLPEKTARGSTRPWSSIPPLIPWSAWEGGNSPDMHAFVHLISRCTLRCDITPTEQNRLLASNHQGPDAKRVGNCRNQIRRISVHA